MELVYKNKSRKIWRLDANHELLHEPGLNLDGKAWHIEKWDDDDMLANRWGFSTKQDAVKFWNEMNVAQ